VKEEEYGIETAEVSEYKTSTICLKSMSDHTYKHKRLFKCLNCGLEAHRDAVGAINMGTLCRSQRGGGTPDLMWNGMSWEPKRAINNKPIGTFEARTSWLQPWRVSNVDGRGDGKWNHCQRATS